MSDTSSIHKTETNVYHRTSCNTKKLTTGLGGADKGSSPGIKESVMPVVTVADLNSIGLVLESATKR